MVALEPGAVWVETDRRSTCSACSARNACGKGLFNQLGRQRKGRVLALTDDVYAMGDGVVIGIPENLLLRSAVLVYLLPLLGLMALALLADGLGLAEPLVILAALLGFVSVWLWLRRQTRRLSALPENQPVVLRSLAMAENDFASA